MMNQEVVRAITSSVLFDDVIGNHEKVLANGSSSTFNNTGIPAFSEIQLEKDRLFWRTFIEVLVLVAIMVVSLLGNISLWIVVLTNKQLAAATSNMLLLSMSLADILVSAVSIPFVVIAVVVGGWNFGRTLCVFLAFFNMTTFISSVMSLASISFNRFVRICKNNLYGRVYSRRNTVGICLGVWTLSLTLAAIPLLDWGRYGYLPGQSICFCEWTLSASLVAFYVLTCFGGPLSAMTFCYVHILSEVRNSRRRAHLNRATSKPARSEEIRLAQSFLVVVLAFILCWLPYCVTMFWAVFSPPEHVVPRWADMGSLMLGFFNSCCNPIIYGIMNKRFRHGYAHLYNGMSPFFCRGTSRLISWQRSGSSPVVLTLVSLDEAPQRGAAKVTV